MHLLNLKSLLFSFTLIQWASCINILYICAVPSRSHYIWNKILALELVQKGHNVTMLTHDTDIETPQNFTVLTMEGFYEETHEKINVMEAFSSESVFEISMLMYSLTSFSAEFNVKTVGFKTLQNYPRDSFDFLIHDITGGLALLALSEKFNNAPIVAVTPFLLPSNVAQMFGSPILTSYMPFYSTQFTDVMNVKERFLNFFYTYFDIFIFNYWALPETETFLKKAFPENTLTLSEIIKKLNILLANTDPILECPIPLPPNVIPVGGLHTKPPAPLPKDLQNLIEEAKQGAIVFSLGTNIESKDFDISVKKALLKAFSKLPQIIFWKFESDDIEDVPKNVIIRKWLPQNDLLGHPNTKLFIGHGGILSTQEAIYHGIPMIGIPFALDQHVNVRRIVNKGIAIYLDRKELTFDNIYQALTTILNDPTYGENVKSLSKKYKSQPQKALERAIFWIEHVIEYGGAQHLNTRARDLSFIQIANIDVLLVFILIIAILCLAITKIISICYRFIKGKNKIKTS